MFHCVLRILTHLIPSRLSLIHISQNAPGEVTSGFLVGVEKVDVFQLAEQYPEAFGRPYDPHNGVKMHNWIQEECE